MPTKRFINILPAALISVLLLTACTSKPDEHDLTGVWMREQEVLPDSTIVTYPNEMGQSFYKVYSDDGTYYLVYMQRQGDKEHLFPQHTATWEVRDGLYIERGDTMDATIHSADSMTVRLGQVKSHIYSHYCEKSPHLFANYP